MNMDVWTTASMTSLTDWKFKKRTGVGNKQQYTDIHKEDGGVCLFFGGSDYEGLPHTYSFIDGVLKDQDGDLIVTRAMESDSGVAVDTVDLVEDVSDHESDMYMRKGLVPDFIKDE